MLEKEKERPIKELLQVMLDNQHLFGEGLCRWKDRLYYWNDLITKKEHDKLGVYIHENRPSKFSSIDAFLSRDSAYYWKCDDIKPRIKWLKKHLKKNK
jgi:hypothetical protein